MNMPEYRAQLFCPQNVCTMNCLSVCKVIVIPRMKDLGIYLVAWNIYAKEIAMTPDWDVPLKMLTDAKVFQNFDSVAL